MSNQEKQAIVNPNKVVTGKCRASYANLNEAKSINGGAPSLKCTQKVWTLFQAV